MSQNRPLLQNLVYRRLTPKDEAQVRELCAECFPITYPDRWYSYITSDHVFSLSAWTEGACSNECCTRAPGNGCGLIGMLVAEIQDLEQLEGEGVLALERSEVNTTAMYVISLGVTKRYRRCGIGHHLMTSLLNHVTTTLTNCWAVYLHVVSSNTPAIGYYAISQRPQDGLLLIRHVNQGEPFSHSFSAYIRRYVSESSTCRLLAGLCQGLRHWLTQFFTSKPNKSTLYP